MGYEAKPQDYLKVNKNSLMESEVEIFPKSPKTPRMNEEISGITLKNLPISEENENLFLVNNDEMSLNIKNGFDCKQSKDNDKEIIKEIIQNAPAGQSQQVSLFCQEIFKEKILQEFIEEETFNKMIKDACPIGEFLVTEDNYNNQTKEAKFGNDSMKISDLKTFETTLTSIESKESEGCSDFQILLQKKLEDYVKELFPETGSFLLHKINEKSWKIHILGQRIKSKTFWSGHWHSNWQIEFKENSNSNSKEIVTKTENFLENDFNFTINGNIELIVHYNEDGNVQLSTEKEIKSLVEMKANSMQQALEKIYWKIRDSENSFQLALNEAYQQLSETIFKKLRRQLPVTRTKMDWSKFVNYNLSNELKK